MYCKPQDVWRYLHFLLLTLMIVVCLRCAARWAVDNPSRLLKMAVVGAAAAPGSEGGGPCVRSWLEVT
jgi:hypothetical protein